MVEIDTINEQTNATKLKNEGLRNELMILVKTNKILKARSVYGSQSLGGILEENSIEDSIQSSLANRDDESVLSFLQLKNEMDKNNNNRNDPYNYKDNYRLNSNDDYQNMRTTNDEAIQSCIVPNTTIVPESQDKIMKTASMESFSRSQWESPELIELNKLLHSRY